VEAARAESCELRFMWLRAYEPADCEAVVRLWNETKRDTYHFIPIEQSRTVDADRDFFRAHIEPRCALWIAGRGASLDGFLALVGSYVDRLYVRPAVQRCGVGEALLSHAKGLSPAGLELHTHQRNAKARAFYEKHGFRAMRLGLSPPPESEPDVEYWWRPSA
jgi:ribosomal protein S18 acetylase RimI-like enzyme